MKCVLTGNYIDDDLQPMREHDTGQGKSQAEETYCYVMYHFSCMQCVKSCQRFFLVKY